MPTNKPKIVLDYIKEKQPITIMKEIIAFVPEENKATVVNLICDLRKVDIERRYKLEDFDRITP